MVAVYVEGERQYDVVIKIRTIKKRHRASDKKWSIRT